MQDEIKNTMSRALSSVDFPSGVIAILGCFSFGVSIFYGEVALDNRKLILGVFLLAISTAWHFISEIYDVALIGFGKNKTSWRINWTAILPSLLFIWLSYKSGRHLWRLLVS